MPVVKKEKTAKKTKTAKKSEKTSKTKKTAKKTVKKTTKKVETETKELSKPQMRILKVLAAGKGRSMSRAKIAEKAPVDNAMCSTYIGSLNPEIQERDSHKNSLMRRGFVKAILDGDGGKTAFQITKAGRKAFDKAK